MGKVLKRLKNYFFPTPTNRYHPGIFRKESVIAIIAILIFLQVAYLAVAATVFHRTNFLAAVLPGVLTALTNTDRTANGVGTLTDNPLLDAAAQASANDMAAKGYFSHVTPDGKSPWYWLDQAGYAYTYAGQNLAVNFNDSTDVEAAWMKSPTHRANIVKPQFTQIGIAVANGKYKGQDATFVVQFFGTPAKVATSASKPIVAVTKTTSSSDTVLGAEIGPGVGNMALTLATSPNHVLMGIALGVLFVLAFLFFLAIFVKVRIQYISVIFGGLILLGAVGASVFVSQTNIKNSQVELPTDTGSSVVYAGF